MASCSTLSATIVVMTKPGMPSNTMRMGWGSSEGSYRQADGPVHRRLCAHGEFDTDDMDIDATIDRFIHHGEVIDARWSADMSEGAIDPATATFLSDPGKQARGDGSVWTGTFHGHFATDKAYTPIDETAVLPTGVSSKFSKVFDNGAVLGAFGATRQQPDRNSLIRPEMMVPDCPK